MDTQRIPINIGKEELKEGFYQQLHDNHFFYLSKKEDGWYFQFFWNKDSILITPKSPPMYARKVNMNDALRILQQEREFIESKLASLTEKTS